MASMLSSPGSPRTLYSTIHLSGPDDTGKIRRKRTIISPEQLSSLESRFKQEQWPNRETKEMLAKEIGMSTHFVNIWFQNKRSRMKKLAQEEAELAAMRQGGILSQEETQPKERTALTGKSEKQHKQASIISMPLPLPGPVAIAPKSPACPVTATCLMENLQHLASQSPKHTPHSSPMANMKFPICSQSSGHSPSPKSPLAFSFSLNLNNSKLHVGGGDIINIIDQNREPDAVVAGKTVAVIQPEKDQVPDVASVTTVTTDHQVMAPTTPTAAHQIQLLAQQQQLQQQQLKQQDQKPCVRYGTNPEPEVILNKLPQTKTSMVCIYIKLYSSFVA